MNAAKSQAMVACQSTYNFEVAVKSCDMHLFDKLKQLEKKKDKKFTFPHHLKKILDDFLNK